MIRFVVGKMRQWHGSAERRFGDVKQMLRLSAFRLRTQLPDKFLIGVTVSLG